VNISYFVQRNVCGQGFVLDYDFVEGANVVIEGFGSVHLT
jgi:hypothetical protein